MNTVHETTHARSTIRIMLDPEPQDPREDDNLGTMVCWHRSYTLGDKKPGMGPEDFLTDLARDYAPNIPEALFATQVERIVRANTVILPLYLYDHSGISMSCRSWVGRAQHAEWDSGQVGFIVCTLTEARENCLLPKSATWRTRVDWQDATGREEKISLREHARRILEGEVRTYDQFLTGMVYGFEVEHEDGGTHSCWGFYQDEAPGAADSYVLAQAKEAAESLDESAKWEDTERHAMACRDIATKH